jgi:RNA polymerase sigma-70 factor (ECF subfamily)
VDRVLRIVRTPLAGDEIGDDLAADEELVAALQTGVAGAPARLVARHGAHVRRILMRVLGSDDQEAADLFQEVMTAAWAGVARLNDPRALKSWLTRIAVFTARSRLRSRQRRRWMTFLANPPEIEAPWAGPELREAARAVYDIFERMPVDERIPYALHRLDDLDLEATADACGMSLSTVRRRLARAERRFFKMAGEYEALGVWLEAP